MLVGGAPHKRLRVFRRPEALVVEDLGLRTPPVSTLGSQEASAVIKKLLLTCHITSYMTCGILTGCVAGHGPLLSNVPDVGYATWLLWSGLSMFLPSQHVGKVITDRIPLAHGLPGSTTVSPLDEAPH